MIINLCIITYHIIIYIYILLISIIHYHVHMRQIGNLGHQFVDGVPTPILTAAILRCLKCGDSQGLAGSLNTLEFSWMTLLAMCFCWGPKDSSCNFCQQDHDEEEDKGMRIRMTTTNMMTMLLGMTMITMMTMMTTRRRMMMTTMVVTKRREDGGRTTIVILLN